jgi:hypothetical protein
VTQATGAAGGGALRKEEVSARGGQAAGGLVTGPSGAAWAADVLTGGRRQEGL